MAEQEIDKLLLEIEVDDKTQGGSKKLVDDFATAVSKLNAEIAKLDVSKFETIAKAMSAIGNVGGGAAKGGSVGKQSAEYKKATKELSALQAQYDEFAKAGVKGDALKSLYEQLGIDEAKKKVEDLQAAQAQCGGGLTLPDKIEQASKNTLQLNTLLDVQKAQLDIIRKKLQDKNLTQEDYIKLKKQELSLEKAMKGTGEKNLFSAIKRVAIYRAIRGVLKAIVNAFKEGFNNLAQFSDEVNQKMSQLQSSFTIIKNSVAVAFLPLLNLVTPIIQRLSVGIAGLANAISYLSAKLMGNTTYLKVNIDYLKKMNEQSRLLSFDTFEKLGGGTDVSGMFEKVQTSDGFGKISEELNEVSYALSVILITLGGIGALKIVSFISSGGLLKAIKGIATSLSTTAGQVGIIFAGVALLAAGIADLVLSWNDVNFEGWEKAITIVAALIAGVVGLVVAVKALKMPVAAAVGLGMALAGAVAIIGTEVSKSTPKNYAFGGGYNSADLFYANENGQTELIASTNSGGGAVMNMQQLESAIYSGMVKAMASGQNGESAIYLDGNKVGTFIAGNNGFRSEANRRNTGLNWR